MHALKAENRICFSFYLQPRAADNQHKSTKAKSAHQWSCVWSWCAGLGLALTEFVLNDSCSVRWSLEVPVPDDGDELRHGELVRNQELSFVQRRKILFLVVSLDDDLQGAVSGWEHNTPSPTPREPHRALTGTLLGNLALMPATSCFLVAVDRRETMSLLDISVPAAARGRAGYLNSSSAWTVCCAAGFSRAEPWYVT